MSADPFERAANGAPALLPGHVVGTRPVRGYAVVVPTWLAIYRDRRPAARMKLRVLTGSARGRVTWCTQTLDPLSHGTVTRLAAWAREVGVDAYDLTSDASLRVLFLGRPVRMHLDVGPDSRGHLRQRIAHVETASRWSTEELDAARLFVAAWVARQAEEPPCAETPSSPSSPR